MEHHATFASIIPSWINFLLFFAFLWWIVRKPFRKAWDSRRASLEKAIRAGEIQRREAQQQLDQARSKAAKIDSELKEIQASIARDSENEARKMLEEAKERAAQIHAQSRRSIEAEQTANASNLRRELAESIVDQARERLAREIDSRSDERLRTAALDGFRGLLQ